MRLFAPTPPLFDVHEWQALPYAERVRLACRSWALQGYGSPLLIHGFYVVKIALYIAGWLATCAVSERLGPPASIGSWWFEIEALARAVLWSMAFEGLGLGCGSGPLTGRYLPPFTAALHFFRPGTVKRPLFPGVPFIGGDRRTILDVAVYLAHYVFLARALVAPEITPELLLPTAVLLPVCGVLDKTLFLVARAEHYFTALVCLLFSASAVGGLKTVWLAVWLWAATSKLNRHFPSVVCVMVSNSPLVPFAWARRRMYRRYPEDLRPSRLAHVMAHTGTALELTFPVLLAFGDGGTTTVIGLTVMVVFHTFITGNAPLGVPLEWNVIMVYGGFVLFGHHAAVPALAVGDPALAVFLVAMLLVVPLVGNFVPRWVSFLLSMRYYAGNWAYSIWLFRGEARQKLDTHIVKAARSVDDQLRFFYDEDTVAGLLTAVHAFRNMHLHGRALHELVPQAVDDIDAYEWYDGEMVAGLVLGWNFGDGHLHDEGLLASVQARCGFEPGELVCIFVESQPMLRPHLDWRIADAAAGPRASGRIFIADLIDRQPWPD